MSKWVLDMRSCPSKAGVCMASLSAPENGDQPGLDKPDAWLEGPMILMQPNEWGSKRIVIDEKRVCTTSLDVSLQLAIHPRAKASER